MNLLLRKVPRTFKDSEELLQQIEFWSLEIAATFDPTKGAKFSTYLYDRLRDKCTNYADYLKMRGKFLPLPDDGADFEDDTDADNIRDQLTCSVSYDPIAALAASEFLESLSADDQQTVRDLLAVGANGEFHSKHFRAKLAELGIDKPQTEALCKVVDRLGPKYLPALERRAVA